MSKLIKYSFYASLAYVGYKLVTDVVGTYVTDNIGTWLKKNIKVKDVNLVSLSREVLRVKFSLSVYNPTDLTVLMNSLKMDVYINQNLISNIITPINARLVSKTENYVELDVDLGIKNLGDEVWSIIKTGNLTNWIIRLVGEANVNNIKIPFTTDWVYNDFVPQVGALYEAPTSYLALIIAQHEARKFGKDEDATYIKYFQNMLLKGKTKMSRSQLEDWAKRLYPY